jgi:hypothetical protein
MADINDPKKGTVRNTPLPGQVQSAERAGRKGDSSDHTGAGDGGSAPGIDGGRRFSGASQAASRKETAGIADSAMKATVSIALCWGLLSVSGLVLLIQLWSYFS